MSLSPFNPAIQRESAGMLCYVIIIGGIMSVDFDLVCHKHKEKVDLCSDGFSGPLTQCDKSMAAFSITHRHCDLNIIDEHNEDCEDYVEWHKNNWEKKLNYT